MARAGRAASILVILAANPLLGQTSEINFTAVSANVAAPGSPVSIRLNRWSTDEERAPVLAALNPAPADPAAASSASAPGQAARGAAGRGRGGAAAVPLTPIAAMSAAIARAPTVGYIWTTDVTGYSIKYAYHSSSPAGERIVLVTDRRLGAYSPGWKPAAAAAAAGAPAKPADYDFTLVEIRMDPRGAGEGKTSLTTKVVADNDARTVALENYAAAPAILEHVKR